MKTRVQKVLAKPGDRWIIEDQRQRGRLELVCVEAPDGGIGIEVYIGDEEPEKAGEIIPFPEGSREDR